MPELHLMRHAAYEGHRPGHHAPPDVPLSAEGQAAARLAALRLPEDIQAIATSPLARAVQTAEIISAATGLPIASILPDLQEWRAPTTVLNREQTDYPPGYRAWKRTRTASPDSFFEDGESLRELHTRAVSVLKALWRLADRHGDLLVVSHKLTLGMCTHTDRGPQHFEKAAASPWAFLETRRLP